MKKWVLRKPYKSKKIVESDQTKVGLIRKMSGFQFTRKDIASMHKGDIISLDRTKTYKKWSMEDVELENGEVRRYPVKREVTEKDDWDLMLDRVEIKSI